MRPSSVPANSRPSFTGDSASVTMLPKKDVEVFFAGSATTADLPEGMAAAQAANGTATATGAKSPAAVVTFLLTPQDAVLAKWVKDSGGTIDIVLRSDNSKDLHTTESVNADTVIDRFKFRVPEEWGVGRR